jgi:hypothetical protein
MTYSIVGGGNIAWYLGTRLQQAGHICAGVYSRNAEHAALLATALHTTTYDQLNSIADNHDICIIAVSDGAIAEVAQQLKLNTTIAIHTAGAVPITAISEHILHSGVAWPIYSLLKNDIPQHNQVPIAWEATDDQTATVIIKLLKDISDQLISTTLQQRQWMHLVAVFSNNFTNHLMAISEQICKEKGLPFSAFAPILQQTFDRNFTRSPHDLQTGPAKRGDHSTLQKHLQLLHMHPEWQRLYEDMSTSIEKMYNPDTDKTT